jgi:hypothetical protein
MNEIQKLNIVRAELRQRDRRGPYKLTSRARVYFFPKGETVLENFAYGRRNRPIAALRALLPEVYEQTKLEPDCQAIWSQKAGCSCGCSPGFILKGVALKGVGYFGFDIFVDYSVEPIPNYQI